jgi:hypothetical protein
MPSLFCLPSAFRSGCVFLVVFGGSLCVFFSVCLVCVLAGCHRITGSSVAFLTLLHPRPFTFKSAPDRRDGSFLTIAFSVGSSAGAHCRPGRRTRFNPNRTSRVCRRLRRWIVRLHLGRQKLHLRHERHVNLVRKALEGVHRAVTFGFFQSVDLIELYRVWLTREKPIGHVYVDTE